MPTIPSLPINPTLFSDFNPTVVTTTVTVAQMQVAEPASTVTKSLHVTVYSLAQGKFKDIPYPVEKSQEKESPSTPSGNNPLVEQQPKVATTVTALQNREDTPWQNTMPASEMYLLREHLGQLPYNG